jgi:hypothetical protein
MTYKDQVFAKAWDFSNVQPGINAQSKIVVEVKD